MKHSEIIRSRIKRVLRVNTSHPDPVYRAKALNIAGRLMNFFRQVQVKEEAMARMPLPEEVFYDCDEEEGLMDM